MKKSIYLIIIKIITFFKALLKIYYMKKPMTLEDIIF